MKHSFDLFVSDKCGEPSNTVYRYKKTINNTSELKAAVTYDHVAAAYKNNTRKNDNYIQSNCIMFDVDNTDSDKPEEWITYDTLRADFKNVAYYIATSRNHLKEKNGKAPRPKFHVYFPIELIKSGREYTALKQRTKELFAYFDKYAADTARFFFGNPGAEVLYFEGEIYLTGFIESLADVTISPGEVEAVTMPGVEAETPPPDVEAVTPAIIEPATQPPELEPITQPGNDTDAPPQTEPTNAAPDDTATPEQSQTETTVPIQTGQTGGNDDNSFLAGNKAGTIPAGERNATMSKFAFTMLVKYGDCEKSRREYAEHSKKCVPPLEVKELKIIWDNAVQAYLQKIANKAGYIPPKEYAQWGEMQPIVLVQPPPFPFSAFPATLSAFMQSISEYSQTAPEMAGGLTLGALGAVFQKKYDVQSINKNHEQLSIYAVAISPPAERKSEVIRHIVTPFHNYQNKYNSDNKEAISRSKTKLKDLKAVLARAEGKLDGTDKKREEHTAAQIALDSFEPVKPLTLIADDTTSEALITLLAENGERILVASGEGGVFSNMKGRYRQGGDDIELYLKGHSGDYISVHRKSREAEVLEAPAISMAICLQPYIIKHVVMDEENTGKGLTGRIVFAYPEARAGTRKAKSGTPPITKDYKKVIFYALEKTVAMTETRTLKLSAEADKYAEEYFNIPEKRIDDGLEKAKSWNGKAFGLAIRIAALFHAYQCCENEKEPADTKIDIETMKRAAEVTECLAAHAQKVFSGDDERSGDALYLLRRIKRYGQRQITKKKMWNGTKQKFKDADRLNEILQFLEERAYIKIDKTPTGGRPAESITVNPAFLHEPANNN